MNLTASNSIRKAGPWVDEDRSKLDPLPPVNEWDDRPATRDIIAKHGKAIQAVRTQLEDDPLYDPFKHDDLWIVRYLLSHNQNIQKAVAAAKAFMIYRAALHLDKADIRNAPPGKDCPPVQAFYNCIEDDAMTFSHPDPNRGVVVMIRMAGLDQNRVAELTDDDWPLWYIMEWMFQVLDSVTRRTGRLTKGVRFVDMKGYSMMQNNRKFLNRNSKLSKACQDHYPQTLAFVYIVNAPTWSDALFRFFKPLVPKRFVEKFSIINPLKNRKEAIGLSRHLSIKHVPTKFGGEFEQWPYPERIH